MYPDRTLSGLTASCLCLLPLGTRSSAASIASSDRSTTGGPLAGRCGPQGHPALPFHDLEMGTHLLEVTDEHIESHVIGLLDGRHARLLHADAIGQLTLRESRLLSKVRQPSRLQKFGLD